VLIGEFEDRADFYNRARIHKIKISGTKDAPFNSLRMLEAMSRCEAKISPQVEHGL
jgi:hypothetical protein